MRLRRPRFLSLHSKPWGHEKIPNPGRGQDHLPKLDEDSKIDDSRGLMSRPEENDHRNNKFNDSVPRINDWYPDGSFILP